MYLVAPSFTDFAAAARRSHGCRGSRLPRFQCRPPPGSGSRSRRVHGNANPWQSPPLAGPFYRIAILDEKDVAGICKEYAVDEVLFVYIDAECHASGIPATCLHSLTVRECGASVRGVFGRASIARSQLGYDEERRGPAERLREQPYAEHAYSQCGSSDGTATTKVE